MNATIDEALEVLAPYGPDLQSGLTNHAPMAIEALCAMDRADAVMPWVERYRKGLMLRPAGRERIGADWQDALGRFERSTDWMEFFEDELREAPWREVAARWTERLTPAVCASAAHGVIRVGHAVRSLGDAETPLRVRELAEALGYWAATYQTLPSAAPKNAATLRAREAIERVPVVPPDERHFAGTIVSSLEALDRFPGFAPVVSLLDTTPAVSQLISELTETFARVALANAHTLLGAIVFVHGVTGLTAIRSLLPLLEPDTSREVIRYGWQASAALYSAFGARPAPAAEIEAAREDAAALVERAIAHGDEHAIKFTEACLREHALNPSPVYLAAARHVIERLPPA